MDHQDQLLLAAEHKLAIADSRQPMLEGRERERERVKYMQFKTLSYQLQHFVSVLLLLVAVVAAANKTFN